MPIKYSIPLLMIASIITTNAILCNDLSNSLVQRHTQESRYMAQFNTSQQNQDPMEHSSMTELPHRRATPCCGDTGRKIIMTACGICMFPIWLTGKFCNEKIACSCFSYCLCCIAACDKCINI